MCTVHNLLNSKHVFEENARTPKSRKIVGDPRMVFDLGYLLVFSLERHGLLEREIKNGHSDPLFGDRRKEGPRKGVCNLLKLS